MDNKQLIEKFYAAFAAGDAGGMIACYADDITFEDPAFGLLKGRDAKNMWRMLLGNNTGIKITARNVEANHETGSADWVAEYVFSRTGRRVVNRVHAQFGFKEGKIVRHTDTFNAWKWAGQALGLSGYLLGWTPFMKNKIRRQTNGLLAKYNAKHED